MPTTTIDEADDTVDIGCLLDVLGNSSAETATLERQNTHLSVLLTFANRAGLQYVVSPMRL